MTREEEDDLNINQEIHNAIEIAMKDEITDTNQIERYYRICFNVILDIGKHRKELEEQTFWKNIIRTLSGKKKKAERLIKKKEQLFRVIVYVLLCYLQQSLQNESKKIADYLDKVTDKILHLERRIEIGDWRDRIKQNSSYKEDITYPHMKEHERIICVASDYCQLIKGFRFSKKDENAILDLRVVLDNVGLNPDKKISSKDFLKEVMDDREIIEKYLGDEKVDTQIEEDNFVKLFIELRNFLDMDVKKTFWESKYDSFERYHHKIIENVMPSKENMKYTDLVIELIDSYDRTLQKDHDKADKLEQWKEENDKIRNMTWDEVCSSI